jgi:hypothetical protein
MYTTPLPHTFNFKEALEPEYSTKLTHPE